MSKCVPAHSLSREGDQRLVVDGSPSAFVLLHLDGLEMIIFTIIITITIITSLLTWKWFCTACVRLGAHSSSTSTGASARAS